MKTRKPIDPFRSFKVTVGFNHKDPLVQIDSEDYQISYTAPTKYHHGLQCGFESDSEEYKTLLAACDKINEQTRVIDNICKQFVNGQSK